MKDFFFDLEVLNEIFFVWILLDSWAVRWREEFWKPPGVYRADLSKSYVRCLLTCVYCSLFFVALSTNKLHLIPIFVLQQQCGKEDVGYWALATSVFKKDWSFAQSRGKLFGLEYPTSWPWLNGMPIVRVVSGGEASFKGLMTTWLASEVIAVLWLGWINFL